MAQSASVIETGIDQIQEVVRDFDKRLRRLQRTLTTRRRRLEKELAARRRTLERRVRRELTRLRRTPVVKRVSALREDAARQVEESLEGLLEALPLATKRDVERVERKLNSLNRKVRQLERA